jgi:hypothetical protein
MPCGQLRLSRRPPDWRTAPSPLSADGWHAGILARDLLDNRPDFSGVVYALDIPATNRKVLDYFPGLPVYKWPNKSKSPECLNRWEAPVDRAQ